MSVIKLKPKEHDTDSPFIVGSTVKLKGGGAIMTVFKTGKAMIEVEWHNADNDPVSYRYPIEMLRHNDPNDEEDKKDGEPIDGGE